MAWYKNYTLNPGSFLGKAIIFQPLKTIVVTIGCYFTDLFTKKKRKDKQKKRFMVKNTD